MFELLVLYSGLSASFSFLTFLVLRKSQNPANIAFATTTSFYAFNTAISGVLQLHELNILPLGDPTPLSNFGTVIFLFAPLGLVYSSYMIVNGFYAWRNRNLTWFSGIYIFMGLVLSGNEMFNLMYVDFAISDAAFNLLICIPLFISMGIFGKLYGEMEDVSKIHFLEVGILIGTTGQLATTIITFFSMGDLLNYIALATIILGVLVASISFTNLANLIKSIRAETPEPIPRA
ncbi:MAG: hypothetical protein ACFFE8_04270 [Candidatus Heimdallarchaeota archaeon]